MSNILIIEDEKNYGEFLLKLLSKDYKCTLATDGNCALQLIKENQYDIILYDLRLPGIMGKELIKYVRNNIDPDIVNIVITGYEQDWSPFKAAEEYVFFYLKKGNFTPQEFKRVIKSAADYSNLKKKEKIYIRNLIAQEKLASTGKLAASIAHEINNPLQCIINITDLLKKKLSRLENGSSFISDLNILENGIDRVRETVGHLLELHRQDYRLSTTKKLNSIVKRVVSFIMPLAKEKDIKLILCTKCGEFDILLAENQFFHVLLHMIMELINPSVESIKIKTEKNKTYALIEIEAVFREKDRLQKNLYLSESSLEMNISKSIINYLGGDVGFNSDSEKIIISIKLPFLKIQSFTNSVFTIEKDKA